MVNVLILEDSEETQNALVAIVNTTSELVKVWVASNLHQAEELLSQHDFDLFFLDVNLDMNHIGDSSGITFAKNIRGITKYEFTPIVFITSVLELELMSYRETQCYRYITKPFQKEEVKSIVEKVLSNTKPSNKSQITVKKDGINFCINTEDIVYIEAMPRGIILNMKNESIQIKYLSIKQILDKLPKESFIQCHRMSVVNMAFIDYVDYVNRLIKMKGYENSIEIGVTFKAEMRRLMNV